MGRVRVTTVFMETKKIFLCVPLRYVSMSITKNCRGLAWRRKGGFPLHCYQATKYSALL
jgi:hypothetical protein